MPALLWGVAFANILRGVPIDADHEYVGGFFNLLNPYALLGGLMTLTLFVTHGAMFLALKTDGDIRPAPARSGCRRSAGAAVSAVGFLLWTQLETGSAARRLPSSPPRSLGRGSARGAPRARGLGLPRHVRRHRAGGGRPLRRPVPRRDADDARRRARLTTTNAAATAYTLKIMTVVAVVFTPVVLVYQGWTYWVFRQRIGTHHIPTDGRA